MTLYYEDLPVGYGRDCGRTTVSRDEIIEFARNYDPQPFHIDESASPEYNDVIASGIHTIALSNRLTADSFYADVAITTGPGIERAYHEEPVQPGDTLSVSATVVNRRRLESRNDVGLVHVEQEVRNQRDVPVSSLVGLVFVERRTTDCDR